MAKEQIKEVPLKESLKTLTTEEPEKSPETQLYEAIVNVMTDINYLQKDDTVGTGSMSYKGITDEKVKDTIRKSMISNGLFCFPVKIDKDTTVERWTEEDQYKKGVMKQKQQIFTDQIITFRIYHISGAYIEGQANGHGIDSQDKGPGKAMTYAMKYFLLNTFMIPTGDDPDKIHSKDIEIPEQPVKKTETVKTEMKPTQIEKSHAQFPTMEDVVHGLFKTTGICGPEIFDGVIGNWEKNGASLLYGKYVYSVKDGITTYFELSDAQLKKIEKKIKFRHG